MSTIIRRLIQNDTEFIPITAAEAVAVDTSTLPGFSAKQITTLDKVLLAIITLVGASSGDLTALIAQINQKQDKLIPGTGIEISDEGVISLTSDITLYSVVTTLPQPSELTLNKIYVVPDSSGSDTNNCNEYITVKNPRGLYTWELVGKVLANIDLSQYAKMSDIIIAVDTQQSIDYDLSELWKLQE